MLQIYLAYSGSRLPEDKENDYLTRIPASMRSLIQRYLRWEDRQAVLFGKLLLLHALRSRASDQESMFLERLEVTEKGKPFIKGGPDFNISHSGGVVLLAIVDSGLAGIDVEKIRPIQVEDFSRYLPEMSDLESSDKSERLKMFYSLWTRKEAVLKAEGSGLLAPLEQVRLSGDKAYFQNHVWHIQNIDCGAGYCCHAATSEPQAGWCIDVVNL